MCVQLIRCHHTNQDNKRWKNVGSVAVCGSGAGTAETAGTAGTAGTTTGGAGVSSIPLSRKCCSANVTDDRCIYSLKKNPITFFLKMT